jgi:hypothetical protein
MEGRERVALQQTLGCTPKEPQWPVIAVFNRCNSLPLSEYPLCSNSACYLGNAAQELTSMKHPYPILPDAVFAPRCDYVVY